MPSNLDLITERAKYYLLDFKDKNYNLFYKWYKKDSLHELSLDQLSNMLRRVSDLDIATILQTHFSKK